jgi:hypothetical protein
MGKTDPPAGIRGPKPPHAFARDHELGRGQTGSPGHRGRRRVVGMDVRSDGSNMAFEQPGREDPCGLRGVAAPLPRRADHPCDIGRAPLVDDRRLDEADGHAIRAAADDPVAPLLGSVGRTADGPFREPLSEVVSARRRAADEAIQGRVGEHHHHLVGCLHRLRVEPQAIRLDGTVEHRTVRLTRSSLPSAARSGG